ncbi:MAG: MaoC family dehydratase [Peptostreptococcales bacterium]|jgi:3-hydroxybutyryl-CoA dehydratase
MKITEIKIGDKQTLTKKITSEDNEKFAEILGDSNPVHLNEEYAQNTMFKGRIAYGMLVSGLISTVIGSKLPGNGSIYLSQTLKFTKPVWLDDTITAEVEVVEMDIEKNRLTLKTRCYNQNDIDVIIGEAIVMPEK